MYVIYNRKPAVPKSNDPGPENPALIAPQPPAPLPARRACSSERGVELILNSGWNGGIMEYRESKTDISQILVSDPCHHHKIRFHSAKPIIQILQYSIIPLSRVTAQPIFSDPAQLPARRAYSPEGKPGFRQCDNRPCPSRRSTGLTRPGCVIMPCQLAGPKAPGEAPILMFVYVSDGVFDSCYFFGIFIRNFYIKFFFH